MIALPVENALSKVKDLGLTPSIITLVNEVVALFSIMTIHYFAGWNILIIISIKKGVLSYINNMISLLFFNRERG